MQPVVRPQKYLKIDLDNMKTADVMSILYTNRARTNLRLKKTRSVIDDATKALYANNSNYWAFVVRSEGCKGIKNYEAAVSDCHEAVLVRPNSRFLKDREEATIRELEMQKFVWDLQEQTVMRPGTSQKLPIWHPVSLVQFDFEHFTRADAQLVTDITSWGGMLGGECFGAMCAKVGKLFSEMPNIVSIDNCPHVIVVGDVHGQLQDVLAIFKRLGQPRADRPYLFNGDFVDRGSQGLEILMVLFAWKIAEPNGIFLNRGNHESDEMNKMYGFGKECEVKLGASVFAECSRVFNALPLGHIIGKCVFVVHGGLFECDNVTIDDLQLVPRFGQPPASGVINDMLWNDPMDKPGIEASPRGSAFLFGPDVTEKFLALNNLKLLIRSHQLVNGYKVEHDGKCITVFSAPNYCGKQGNDGAVCHVRTHDGELLPLSFDTFKPEPIPREFPPILFTRYFRYT